MRRWLREPLLHFALAGAAIFALEAVLRPASPAPDPSARERIVVTQERLVQLATGFARARQRAPTDAELAELVEDFVREEVLYRHALELRLDEDDVIVRRRLRQKAEFLLDEQGAAGEPGDDALAAHLAAHADTFRLPAQVAFEQRLFAGAGGRADAQAASERLRRGDGAGDAGAADASLLPEVVPLAPLPDIIATFGAPFAQSLQDVTPGTWSRPLQSSYGWHVVRVVEHVPGRVPTLDEARERVRIDLVEARRRAAVERAYTALAARYEIVVPESPAKAGVAAGARTAIP